MDSHLLGLEIFSLYNALQQKNATVGPNGPCCLSSAVTLKCHYLPGSVGMRRLNTLVSTLVLRRTKEEMTERRLITLTNKEVRTHMVQLQEKEREVYQVLFQEAQ